MQTTSSQRILTREVITSKGPFCRGAYAERDTNETGGDDTEYELVDHEFENKHLSKSSEGTI